MRIEEIYKEKSIVQKLLLSNTETKDIIIKKRVRAGIYGSVYEIKSEKYEKQILKVVMIDESDCETYNRQLEEYKTLLSHIVGDSLIRINNYYELQGEGVRCFCFFMHSMNDSLEERIRHNQYLEYDAIKIGKSIAKAMVEYQNIENRIVHGSICPGAIFSFGNRRGERNYVLGGFKSDSIFEPQVLIGKNVYGDDRKLYQAAEYRKSENNIDIRADIYALGVTLYEYANCGNLNPIRERIKQENDEYSVHSPIKASKSLSQVILKMIEQDVNDRYQSPEEVLSEFENLEKQWNGKKTKQVARIDGSIIKDKKEKMDEDEYLDLLFERLFEDECKKAVQSQKRKTKKERTKWERKLWEDKGLENEFSLRMKRMMVYILMNFGFVMLYINLQVLDGYWTGISINDTPKANEDIEILLLICILISGWLIFEYKKIISRKSVSLYLITVSIGAMAAIITDVDKVQNIWWSLYKITAFGAVIDLILYCFENIGIKRIGKKGYTRYWLAAHISYGAVIVMEVQKEFGITTGVVIAMIGLSLHWAIAEIVRVIVFLTPEIVEWMEKKRKKKRLSKKRRITEEKQ